MCALHLPLALSLGRLLSDSAATLLVMGLAFVIITLIASFVRYQHLSRAIQEGSPEEVDAEDVLKLRLLERLGTAHRMPEPFAVMIFCVSDRAARTTEEGEDSAARLDRLEEHLRKHIRQSDFACRYRGEFLAAVVDCERRCAAEVGARLCEALRNLPPPAGKLRAQPLDAVAGIVTFPENGDRARVLADSAERVLEEIRGAAAQECRLMPPLEPETSEAAEEEEEEAQASSSLIDPLTGVMRPERLGAAMQKYVAQFRKRSQPVSMILIDVDFLNRYNEHYGREAGDAILRGMGKLLEDHVRITDLIGRYADDAFILVVAGSPQGALALAQRLTVVIKKSTFQHRATRLRVTVSMGIAGYPDHGSVPRRLFEAAEAALLVAQQRGKGQTLIFDPASMSLRKEKRPVDSL